MTNPFGSDPFGADPIEEDVIRGRRGVWRDRTLPIPGPNLRYEPETPNYSSLDQRRRAVVDTLAAALSNRSLA